MDIGGGTTDIAIFERGALWHTAVIGVGGEHFTNDIAVGLRMPIPDADKLKRKCGCSPPWWTRETMEVASVGGRRPRVMPRRILSEILQPRAGGDLPSRLGRDSPRRLREGLNSGIVLTGGGAILDGLPEIAEQIFDLPIRRGSPTGVGGLADHVNSPAFASAVGLTLYAQRGRTADAGRMGGAGAFARIAGRFASLLREFF